MTAFFQRKKQSFQFVDPTSSDVQLPLGATASTPATLPQQNDQPAGISAGPPEISHVTSAIPMVTDGSLHSAPSTPAPIPIMVKAEPEIANPDSVTLPTPTAVDMPSPGIGGLDAARPAGEPHASPEAHP